MNIRKILSPAKINLALQVLSKRFDGYHNINTVFFKIPFFDEIIFEEAKKTEIICEPELNFPMEENLIFKTIDLVKKKSNIDKHIKVKLYKKIPTGGGLGGGSSNAATTLKFLNQFWQLELNEFELIEIGLELGSDVPFFLTPYIAAIGKGRGEILNEIKLNFNSHLLLITTNIHISTKEAYTGLALKEEAKEIDFNELMKEDIPFKDIFFNDFERTIFKKHSELSAIKALLYENQAKYAGMSGSGSTMFGLFDNLRNIQQAVSSLNKITNEYSELLLKSYLFQL